MSAAQLVQPLSVVFLLAMMASIGLKVSFAEVVSALRNTRLIVGGVLASFVLTPIVTVLFLHAYRVQPMVAVGFLILAVCAGAPFLPAVTGMAGGNVAASVGLMVLLASLSAVLAPVLLGVLLARLPGAEKLSVDFFAILKTLLVTQIVPLGLALAFHAWKPAAAQKLVKPLTLLSQVLLLALNVVLFIAYWDDLKKFHLSAYVGMLLLFAAMFVIGWLLGGPGRGERKAMALSTAIRNTGVGLVIVAANFANTPAVPSVTVFALVMTIAAIICSFPMRHL